MTADLTRSVRMARPRRHVVMTVIRRPPTTRGNQPPWGIFRRLAAQKARSTTRNAPVIPPTTHRLHRHRSLATTANSNVVMTIVVVTATP